MALKLLKKHYSVNVFEVVYLAIYAVYIFASILDSSLISLGILKTLINYVALGSLAALFVVKTNDKRFYRICLALFVFVIAAFASDRLYLIVYMMLLFNASYTNFRKIVNVSFFVTVLSVVFVVFCCKVGIVQDLIYSRDGIEIAHSYGFGHYSSLSYFGLYITIMWLYLRNKPIGYIELVILIVVNYFIYHFTTTRLGFYLLILVIIMYVILEKMNLINLASKPVVFLSTLAFPVAFVGCILLDKIYDPDIFNKDSFLYKLDMVLNNRLEMGHKALIEYSPKLFGQHIEMVGIKTAVFGKGNNEYFYIDSGYVYAFLGYGILFTLVILLLYTLIIRGNAKSNDAVIFIWAFTVMLFTISNNAWVSITYNPLLFYAIIPYKNNAVTQLFKRLNKKYKLNIKV